MMERRCTGYAHRKIINPEQWHDFGRTKLWVSTCGEEPIFPVEIIEDEQGSHFAWWDNKDQRFHSLWWSRQLLDMCFANGHERAEARGEGKFCTVSVTIREEQE